MLALLGKPSSQFILASLTVVLCIDIYTDGAVIESTKWTQPRCDCPPIKSDLACGLTESREKGLFS